MQCLTLVYVSDISSCVFCVCRHTHTTQVKLISYRFVYNKQQKYNLPRTYASLQCVHIYYKRDNKVLSIKYLLDTYLYDTHILLNENPCYNKVVRSSRENICIHNKKINECVDKFTLFFTLKYLYTFTDSTD